MSKTLDRLSDRELVQRCQQGQTDAFRHLYQRYQQRIRATLFQLCGDRGLDDLVQDVFLKAWKGLPSFRQDASFSTWIYRICWNVASDRRRQLARRKPAQLLPEIEQILASDRAPAAMTPDLMQLHYQDLVMRGLTGLSLEHRGVLVLHDLEDLPQKEIAQILQIPVGTVKSRLFAARRSLRKYLESQGVTL